jgi:glycosyltransferase involved in cell wall biosynthesis
MMVKIVHVSANQYPKLTQEHHSKAIWKELAKGCDEYHVIARSQNMRFKHYVEGNIHLHLVPSFGKRQAVFALTSFVLFFYFWRIRPTHVLVQCPVLGGFFSALFQPLFKYHLVSEIHGEHILRPMGSSLISKIKFKFFKIFSMFNFSVAKSIRTLSPSMTTMIENVYGIQIAEKVYFVPNRVDMKVFNKYKTDYGIGDTLKIITVGRFTKLKNHMSLIQDLYKSNINFDLTIIGGGQLKTQYLAL